jgi:hypothetical protein
LTLRSGLVNQQMTLARLLPFHIHGALEAALAPVIMVAPFLFGFELPAAIASVTIGALLMAVALATHAADENALPVSTHAAFDVGFAVALALCSILFGFTGDLAAAAFLGTGAVALVLLNSLTRYSASRA